MKMKPPSTVSSQGYEVCLPPCTPYVHLCSRLEYSVRLLLFLTVLYLQYYIVDTKSVLETCCMFFVGKLWSECSLGIVFEQ